MSLNNPLDITRLKSRVVELNKQLEVHSVNHNACQHNWHLQVKQLELAKLEIENQLAITNAELTDLEIEENGTNISKQNIDTCPDVETFRRDMLWQTYIMMGKYSTAFTSDTSELFRNFFDANTGSKKQNDRCMHLAKPLIQRQIPTCSKNFNTVLITTYMYESDKTVKEKLLNSIQRCIDNSSFEHIVIMVTNHPRYDLMSDLNSLDLKDRASIIESDRPAKFTDVQELCRDQIAKDADENTAYVLSNPGCYYDMDALLIKKFDLSNRVLCLGSKDNLYYQMDAIVLDDSWLTLKLKSKANFVDYIGMEQFVSELHTKQFECINLSAGGYIRTIRGTSNMYVNRENCNKQNMYNTVQLKPSDINYDNFVNGDTCEWNKDLPYYTDRLKGQLGTYFETNAARLFYMYTNQLAVFYLCCEREIISGQLEKSLRLFTENTPSQQYSFDLLVCVDKLENPEAVKEHLNRIVEVVGCNCINKIDVKLIPIPPEDNVFTYDISSYINQPHKPRLGASHGVNQLFYDGLKQMMSEKYKHLLMLETDCQPVQKYWFDTCLTYCEKDPDFVVAGSKHKGASDMHRNTDYANHINGVALYRNDDRLAQLLTGGEEYLEAHVKKNKDKPVMNFDVANYLFAKNEKLEEYLVDTKFISNYSSAENKETSVKRVLTRHPDTVILHKKFGSKDI